MTIAKAAGIRPVGSGPSITSRNPGDEVFRRMVGTVITFCAAILVTYALPAHSLYLGGSFTWDNVPRSFQNAYGSDLHGEKIYARIVIGGAPSMGF